MDALNNKRILIGVSGGIAAYKTPDLIRRLQQAGAEVRVVMTPAATHFITPATLQAISGHPVYLDGHEQSQMGMDHIALARWPDVVLIAPATAQRMAQLAHGHAADLLATLCLATQAPIAIAPAMNQYMWQAAATQRNCSQLLQDGIHIWGPGVGDQACGDTGPGRMLEPSVLIKHCANLFSDQPINGGLTQKRVIITAGPTREALDPVRYITNQSSGKMGFALAKAAVQAGAKVTLIAGPVTCETPPGCHRIDVISANEMHDAVMTALLSGCDLFIGCAAIADYRPICASKEKIKKDAETLTLEFAKNPDIIQNVAAHPKRPFTVGFAAETHHVLEHARLKLKQKKLDMIIANEVSENKGFNQDHNEVIALWPGGERHFTLKHKQALAQDLVATISEKLNEKHTA